MGALQDVLAYAVTHPWKTVLLLALAVYAIGATWQQLIVVLLVAAFVAMFDA